MGIIVAIGGYKSQSEKNHTFDTPLSIDRRIVGLTGKKHPNVLFIPTASSDSERYVVAFTKNYKEKLSCKMDALYLIKEKPGFKEIKRKISWADLIYVGGGNTLMMMNKWRRLGVDRLLCKAYEQGIILSGVSAGSICWFEYGVSDSRQFKNKKSHKYIRVSGLGFLKGLHNPHHGSKTLDNQYRMAGLNNILENYGDSGRFIGIKDGEAVVFVDGEIQKTRKIKRKKP